MFSICVLDFNLVARVAFSLVMINPKVDLVPRVCVLPDQCSGNVTALGNSGFRSFLLQNSFSQKSPPPPPPLFTFYFKKYRYDSIKLGLQLLELLFFLPPFYINKFLRKLMHGKRFFVPRPLPSRVSRFALASRSLAIHSPIPAFAIR